MRHYHHAVVELDRRGVFKEILVFWLQFQVLWRHPVGKHRVSTVHMQRQNTALTT